MGRKDYSEEQVLSAFEKFSAQQATQMVLGGDGESSTAAGGGKPNPKGKGRSS